MRRRAHLGVVSLWLASVVLVPLVAVAKPPPAPPGDDDGAEEDDNPYASSASPPTPPRAAPVPRTVVPQKDGMLLLPGGRFTMGSADRSTPSNEHPSHEVTVAPFWIDRTEVTVGAYRACVERGSCARPARSSATCTYDLDDPDLPISCVAWQAAEGYCLYAGKRLPQEAEWEFAARGLHGGRYPWGGVATSCAFATTLLREATGKTCTKGRPSRVGAHPMGASVWGVLDLSGNVEEWTADWYAESYGAGGSPRAGASHTLRGGGWLSPPSAARTTSRDWGSSVEAGPNVGFRCAKTP